MACLTASFFPDTCLEKIKCGPSLRLLHIDKTTNGRKGERGTEWGRAWRRDKDLAVKEAIKANSGEPGLHLKAGVRCRVRRIKWSSLLDRKSLCFS